MTTLEVQPVVTEAEDAERRLPELRLERQRLSLDAASDPQLAAELAEVESEVRNCELALERATLAAVERGRRDAESRDRAEAEAREAALQQARSLQSERERAARGIDSGARRLAAALADYDRICREQDVALAAADRRPSANAARMREMACQSAVAFALREASAPRVLDLPALRPADVALMIEADHRPVEASDNNQNEKEQ